MECVRVQGYGRLTGTGGSLSNACPILAPGWGRDASFAQWGRSKSWGCSPQGDSDCLSVACRTLLNKAPSQKGVAVSQLH